MHDVGKIFVPVEILNAPRKLTEDEFKTMQLHPVYSAEFFEDIPGMEELAQIIRHHHERFDGKGIPRTASSGRRFRSCPALSEVVADV